MGLRAHPRAKTANRGKIWPSPSSCFNEFRPTPAPPALGPLACAGKTCGPSWPQPSSPATCGPMYGPSSPRSSWRASQLCASPSLRSSCQPLCGRSSSRPLHGLLRSFLHRFLSGFTFGGSLHHLQVPSVVLPACVSLPTRGVNSVARLISRARGACARETESSGDSAPFVLVRRCLMRRSRSLHPHQRVAFVGSASARTNNVRRCAT